MSSICAGLGRIRDTTCLNDTNSRMIMTTDIGLGCPAHGPELNSKIITA